MKNLLFIYISCIAFSSSLAQNDTSKTRPSQVTFLYPLGTNGVETDYVNNFSFNILYGVNGGLNGFELGGLMNTNLGHVNGCQIAGIANMNSQAANGMMIAGIGNFVKDTSNAICFAGISNVIGGSATGLQIAGISNTVNGDFMGGQIAGITNITNGNFFGPQISGITNIAAGNADGTQISGISNLIEGDLNGAQIGLINRAKKINGFQLGLINISDSFEKGAPLGLISFVKKGYHSLELSTRDLIYVNLNFKMGVERLYTIYKAGFTASHGTNYWSIGLGIGTKIKFTERLNLSVDLANSSIIRQTFSPRINLLTELDLAVRYNFGERITAFAGPTFNVYNAEFNPSGETPDLVVPYSIHTWNWLNSQGQTFTWVGATAGVAVNF